MHRLLVWTGKGGTGKTTTVSNLGPELARLGYSVLMVGADPQGDLESTFGIDEDNREVVRLEQLLEGGGGDPTSAPIEIPIDGAEGRLRLLACSSDLAAAAAGIARRGYRDVDRILEAFVDDTDLVLLDTQGSLSPLSHAAARAADSVLFCMEPGWYEYRALGRRLAELETIKREEGCVIAPLGVFFVRVDGRSRGMREYREHFGDAEAFGGDPLYVFAAHSRQQSSVRDHPRLARPTVLAEPASNVAADYRALAAELVERIATVGQATS